MATKKSLEKLISGIVSEKPQEVPAQSPKDTFSVPSQAQEADVETRATFIVGKEVLRKVKLIAAMGGMQIKDVVGTALSAYVAQWEAENGEVDVRKRG